MTGNTGHKMNMNVTTDKVETSEVAPSNILSTIKRIFKTLSKYPMWILRLIGKAMWQMFWWCIGKMLRFSGEYQRMENLMRKKAMQSNNQSDCIVTQPSGQMMTRSQTRKKRGQIVMTPKSSYSVSSCTPRSSVDNSTGSEWYDSESDAESDCSITQVKKKFSEIRGVGHAVVGVNGKKFGFVTEETQDRRAWRLSTGRIVKKATYGKVWVWKNEMQHVSQAHTVPKVRSMPKEQHVAKVNKRNCVEINSAEEAAFLLNQMRSGYKNRHATHIQVSG
jgi:hypothetical protein